ncbi:hypothetical protein GUJ93_ZPchr0003g16999 [Zizania palustris]|uniref:Uncharacterized protein n=1 Tax=Zizania palustris TaxID=103762 RepID=A0A8J5V5N1_ZIZPA|nr:hypothetical protein GUJ93_ZPchr0003g16999 [Zizania palustris]
MPPVGGNSFPLNRGQMTSASEGLGFRARQLVKPQDELRTLPTKITQVQPRLSPPELRLRDPSCPLRSQASTIPQVPFGAKPPGSL